MRISRVMRGRGVNSYNQHIIDTAGGIETEHLVVPLWLGLKFRSTIVGQIAIRELLNRSGMRLEEIKTNLLQDPANAIATVRPVKLRATGRNALRSEISTNINRALSAKGLNARQINAAMMLQLDMETTDNSPLWLPRSVKEMLDEYEIRGDFRHTDPHSEVSYVVIPENDSVTLKDVQTEVGDVLIGKLTDPGFDIQFKRAAVFDGQVNTRPS